MPRHAIEAGLADAVLPLSGLAGAIAAQIQS
jgi:chemotaxis response regulator CheB